LHGWEWRGADKLALLADDRLPLVVKASTFMRALYIEAHPCIPVLWDFQEQTSVQVRPTGNRRQLDIRLDGIINKLKPSSDNGEPVESSALREVKSNFSLEQDRYFAMRQCNPRWCRNGYFFILGHLPERAFIRMKGIAVIEHQGCSTARNLSASSTSSNHRW